MTPALEELLGTETFPLDLPCALRLAGVQNPQLLIAGGRVTEAVALRRLAAAQFLPSLHLGVSSNDHNGTLQQSSGNILTVDRNSVYFGAGAAAVGAGTVTIPGLVLSGNAADVAFGALAARQVVAARGFDRRAVENQVLLRVAVAYTEVVRAETRVAVARRVVADAAEVKRLTEAFFRSGAGNAADADRADTEFRDREADLVAARGEVPVAAARLAELLSLDPAVRLIPAETNLVPCPVVPDLMPLPELLAVAITNRPELGEQQALIRQALAVLRGARLLPVSPTVTVGVSYGGEGGGSDLVNQNPGASPFAQGAPRFGRFAERLDVDAVAVWALQNLGVGNKALIDAAGARVGAARFQFLERLDQVRAEVANAHARVYGRFAQIAAAEAAVREATESYQEDARAVRGGLGRPIELLASLRLLARSRAAYLDAIADYNEAQFELSVALGRPPAAAFARPLTEAAPTGGPGDTAPGPRP